MKDSENIKLTQMAQNMGADEIVIEYKDFYNGYTSVWKTVAKFFRKGKLINWVSF